MARLHPSKTRATMMIDAQCKVENDPFGQERALWDSLSS